MSLLPQAFIINALDAVAQRRAITAALPPMLPYALYTLKRGSEIGNSQMLGNHILIRPDDLTPDQFARKIAHLDLMQRLLNSSMPQALILEDHVRIPAGFDRALKKLMARLPEDYDIAYLSYNLDMHVNAEVPGIGSVNFMVDDFQGSGSSIVDDDGPVPLRLNRVWGLPAYLISRAGAEKILGLATGAGLGLDSTTFIVPTGFSQKQMYRWPNAAIDMFIMANLPHLNGYISWPIIAFPETAPSSALLVESDVGNG